LSWLSVYVVKFEKERQIYPLQTYVFHLQNKDVLQSQDKWFNQLTYNEYQWSEKVITTWNWSCKVKLLWFFYTYNIVNFHTNFTCDTIIYAFDVDVFLWCVEVNRSLTLVLKTIANILMCFKYANCIICMNIV
jgi:hypothetical protein